LWEQRGSYKEVLNRTSLPIYSGGESFPLTTDKAPTVEKLKRNIVCNGVGESTVLKGAIFGGLENNFSPLKTRSARKLGKVKEIKDFTGLMTVDGPRSLRGHKSLARVKK
jgi:hypothetical protein